MRDFVWRVPAYILPGTLKSFHFTPVSEQSILKQLKQLKRKKAPSLDALPPNMLKDCAQTIYKPLTHIINLSLRSSTVPCIWKKAHQSFKTGSAIDPDNYRPNSVLPILSKIL